MHITKRDGTKESVNLNKISRRIETISKELNLSTKYVDTDIIAQKTVAGMYNNIAASEIDTLAAETAAGMATHHPDYLKLAAGIEVSNLHKNTLPGYLDRLSKLVEAGIVRGDILQKAIQFNITADGHNDEDYRFNYFGLRTLMKSYLLRIDGEVVERPQDLYIRVALELSNDEQSAKETYKLLREHYYTHATPTLFNSGTNKNQLASCFLLDTEDSIKGIYKTLSDCADISKMAGGIGFNVNKIRSKYSPIEGTGGRSNGIVPMLKVFNETARYVDQGGGKRKGSFAAYMEPWHADVFDFLELKRPHGKEENKARDLFLGLWMNNLFFERVKNNSHWTLFSPSEAPQLGDVYGEEFERMYISLENRGLGKRINAQELWSAIISSQIESGVPYLLNKDEANEKSNQKNLGTIRNSNLCTEIIQYSSEDEHAVCNLASIALPKFVSGNEFDFESLGYVVAVATRNLNNAIDSTMYPTPEARNSNMTHRPIGLGVQGLADVFFKLNIAFDSTEAKALNKKIFENIYFYALKESNRLSKQSTTYGSYHGSPVSQGILQQDMWKDVDHLTGDLAEEWKILREDIAEYGVKNSLLVAPMPTASTASILGNTEAFEPITSNLYVRRVLAGEFIMINEYLVKRLIKEGLWSESMRRSLINSNGSVQNLNVPQSIKDVYKTAYELSQRVIIDLAADRAVYIDQSQSMNLFMRNPSGGKLSSMYMYAWGKGLKTMQYYLRSSSAVDAKKITVVGCESCSS